MTPTDEERECQESVDLKDPWLAAFLAWLIPGLGHLYQGRTAKAGLFFVCIMGTFLYGLYLGSGGQLLLFNVALEFQDELHRGVISPDLRLDFENHQIFLSDNAGVSTEEEGNRWRITDETVVYTVTKEGNTLNIFGRLGWGRVVYFSWQPGDRRLAYLCQVGIGLPALPALVQAGRVSKGERPLLGGFMAPAPLVGKRIRGSTEVDESGQPTLSTLHRQLHRYFELGTVYTMIAGLLNILAVYDAWGGPVFSQPAKKDHEDQEDHGDQEDQDKDAPPEVPS